ncbi:MAG TPA: glucoamylase family protein [Gemmatimonadales bacterium]|nr:glucoamylase family protein [Gemmatimonadales bacterium]
MTESRTERMRAAGAAAAARWQLLDRRPRRALGTPARWREVAAVLDDPGLVRSGGAGPGAVGAARLLHGWLLDCRHAATRLRRALHAHDGKQALPRAYLIAGAYLDAVSASFDVESFLPFVDAAQAARPLDTAELWALKPMLQLELLERLAAAPDGDPSRDVFMDSLRAVGEIPWREVVDELSVVERVLRQDPAGVYARMDADTRDQCHGEVAELAARTGMTEVSVAEVAVALAREAEEWPAADARVRARLHHVGFYLIGRGAVELRHRIGYRPPMRRWATEAVLAAPAAFYMGGVALVAALLVALVQHWLVGYFATVWGGVLLVPLAVQAAVEIMGGLAAFLVPPRPLPKLDFADGIPDDCTTMVAVPTLLLDEAQVRELVNDLEVRFLANRDPNLHFALLTDPPDSSEPVDHRDQLVELAAQLIDELNAKYAHERRGSFFLFHRHRVYNPGEQAWMGWERKRGKLLDFNQLLRNARDRFPVKRGDLSVLPRVQYVITLDSDTQLPPGSAHRLVGTIAHPLNRAVIDPIRNLVVDGYGIIQPRVGVSVTSALRSRLAAIYSGQTGVDIYTRAVSDVYQDLFQEGTFTGKGIYEVDVLRAVLERRFPTNSLLSHDLIEGAYARAGLASDIEVIDDYPSHYSAYNRRKHRWVRGDWQVARWLLPRVPDYYGRLIPNPISMLSRWKIHDNLRRSTIEPLTAVLLLAGWLVLVGTADVWTAAALALLATPPYVLFVLDLLRIRRLGDVRPRVRGALDGLWRAHVGLLVYIAFLAHQTMVQLDAVFRSMVRSFITKRKLLEWETAAEVERDRARRTPIDQYLDAMPLVALALALVIHALSPASLPIATPILLLWAASKPVAKWLNGAPDRGEPAPGPATQEFLRGVALRTWHYFRDFGGASHHWLIPDNVQVEPALVAQRTSPTNLGFLLNARLAAVELGYLTLPEAAEQSRATLDAIGRLERVHGHLLNWYDTRTGEAIAPRFVSTVDSGNLAVACWALAEGMRELATRPLFGPALWTGIRDHLAAAGPAAQALRDLVAPLGNDSAAWLAQMDALLDAARPVAEVRQRLAAIRAMADRYAPWCLPARPESYAALALPDVTQVAPAGMADRITGALAQEAAQDLTSEQRARLEATRTAHVELLHLLDGVAASAERLVAEMDFRPLFERRRRLLSVGLDADTGHRVPSCYDLLASEARLAAFVAIAKGEIPVESWFRSGRPLVSLGGTSTLLSWSGTMFEYLMPTLWMRAYPDTQLDRSARAAVLAQVRFGREYAVPWGISESAYAVRDSAGVYQYYAFGVPALRLRPEAEDRLVIAPYATCLALGVHPALAIGNLERMASLGWLGRYGFFEAADYEGEGTTGAAPELVRTWMAHHQGMSLLALANLLANAPFTRWFHAARRVQAVELLLQERVPVAVAAAAPRPRLREPRRQWLRRRLLRRRRAMHVGAPALPAAAAAAPAAAPAGD